MHGEAAEIKGKEKSVNTGFRDIENRHRKSSGGFSPERLKQGYKDSNLEMTESESVALPFGDSPLSSANVIVAQVFPKCKYFFKFFKNLSFLNQDLLNRDWEANPISIPFDLQDSYPRPSTCVNMHINDAVQ